MGDPAHATSLHGTAFDWEPSPFQSTHTWGAQTGASASHGSEKAPAAKSGGAAPASLSTESSLHPHSAAKVLGHYAEAEKHESSAPAAADAESGTATNEQDEAAGETAHTAASPRSASGKAKKKSPAGIPVPSATAGAHDAPFERKVSKRTRYFAKQDAYNNKRVRSNAMHTDRHVGRPGVRVGGEKKGHDLFTLKHASAPRYTFITKNGHNEVLPFDVVEKDKLTIVNFKFDKKPQPQGKTRLLLNPAKARHLEIAGQPSLCVLSWYGGLGAAWIRVDDLAGGSSDHAEIVSAANGAAKKWNPKRAAKSEKLEQFTFRNDAISTGDEVDKGPKNADGTHSKGLKIGPNNGGGGNAITDYLRHTTKGTSYINICMSLPQSDAPPVAIDVVRPGDMFFVPTDAKFRREVGIYGSKKKTSNRRQLWVYGFVGKQEKGSWVADRTRCGWVPMRTVQSVKK